MAESLGDAARYVHLDVTDPASWKSAAEYAVSEFGAINGLVNNAGISASGQTVAEEPLETFQRIIQINLVSVHTGIHTVVPFITRSVTLAGIDSVYAPTPARIAAWDLLEKHLDLATLAEITETVPLAAAPEHARAVLAGTVRGRIVVDVVA